MIDVKVVRYTVIVALLLTVASGFLIIRKTDLFPSNAAVDNQSVSPTITLGGCSANMYNTGLPFSYNEITIGTCVESQNPQINYAFLLLDLIIYLAILYPIILFTENRDPRMTKKTVFWFSTICLLGIIAAAFWIFLPLIMWGLK